MKQLLLKLLRDLAFIPVTAVLVYVLVMHLPYKADNDTKILDRTSAELATAQLHQTLGTGGVLDAWKPWDRLLRGESVGVRGHFDGNDFEQALGQSARLGLMALGWALLGGALFALLRVQQSARVTGRILDVLPAIIFGSPPFAVAIVIALIAFANGFIFMRSEVFASLAMAIAPSAFIGVVLADALRAERSHPYFLTALAKGCSEQRALLRHALPNALPTLLDAVAPVATSLITGSFVVEKLFKLEGFGFWYVKAASNPDPGTVVVATTIFASALVLISILVELTRFAIDPRTRRALVRA